MKGKGMRSMPGARRLARGLCAMAWAGAIVWIAVLVAGGWTVLAAEEQAVEATKLFSGVAERQITAPVPQPVWMAAAIMGLVILAGMRRVRRGRHAR